METPIVMFTLALLAAAAVTTRKTKDYNYCEDPDNYFDCGDGHCVRKEYVCDMRKQCPNDADERKNCPTQSACSHKNQFMCTDGSCIPGIQKCDGQDNCEDGSDEKFKKCSYKDCKGKNQFRCSSVTQPKEPMYCLALDFVCDGVQDCPEGEDETSDLCPSRTYSNNNCEDPENYFDCGDGHCIKVQYVCDTRTQCPSGVDEDLHCPDQWTCNHENQFRCTDGPCIPGIKACDGRADCEDGWDEYNGCRFKVCDGTNQFRCSSVTQQGEPMYCLALDSVCDGVKDCPEGEDETSDVCPSLTYNETDLQYNQPCKNSAKFNCGNGQCLAQEKVCDGWKDCRNYADEAKCP